MTDDIWLSEGNGCVSGSALLHQGTESLEPVHDAVPAQCMPVGGGVDRDHGIDIGFGDALEPEPETLDYPVLLDMPAPQLRGYARETVIAEKFEAITSLGRDSTRMKNFHDIWILSRAFIFTDDRLARAMDSLCRNGRCRSRGSRHHPR